MNQNHELKVILSKFRWEIDIWPWLDIKEYIIITKEYITRRQNQIKKNNI